MAVTFSFYMIMRLNLNFILKMSKGEQEYLILFHLQNKIDELDIDGERFLLLIIVISSKTHHSK